MNTRTVRLIALTGALVVAACTQGAAPAPATPSPAASAHAQSFEVDYDSGSIPPPANDQYLLTGSFSSDGATLAVHYLLTYSSSAKDDIDWSGTLTGDSAARWQTLVGGTVLGPIPPLLPGSPSFTVTITPYQGGSSGGGVPTNRDAWQALIDAVDQQARAELGKPRSSP